MNKVVKNPIQYGDPESMVPSPFNPRKHLGDLTDLIASVRKDGLLQPIVVRQVAIDGPDAWRLEVVFGHRRRAAAIAGGLDVIPYICRTFTDDEALTVQIVENSQREDVHPVDEADSFVMLRDRGHTLASIADSIGRPPSFVAKRMQLANLTPKGRKAYDDGLLTLGAAMAICRIPLAKTQDEVTKHLTNSWQVRNSDGQVSAGDAEDMIQRNYMLRLKDADFDVTDPKCVPKAGACTECPKRTGAQSDLFGEIASDDQCLDVVCYRRKLDVQFKFLAKTDTENTYLQGKAAKAAHHYSSPYQDMARTHWINGRDIKTSTIMRKAPAAKKVFVQHEDSHAHMELVHQTDLAKAMKIYAPNERDNSGYDKEHRERMAKEKEAKAVDTIANDRAIIAAVTAETNHSAFNLDDVLFLYTLDKVPSDVATKICKRLELEITRTKPYYKGHKGELQPKETLIAAVELMAPAHRVRIQIELILRDWASNMDWSDSSKKNYAAAMKAFGVDLTPIKRKVRAERKAAKKPKKKPAPKKKAS